MVSPTSPVLVQRPSVFIGDSSALDCQLLAASLIRNRMQVAGWATKSSDVISEIKRCRPNVALIAVRLEDGPVAGLGVLRALQLASPEQRIVTEPRIIMLLDASEPAVVVESFCSGADGVFSREQMSSALSKCIRCVLAGQFWANTQEIRYLVGALRSSPTSQITHAKSADVLTKREREVVTLVANGLTNRDVAERLGLSEHTVKNYLLAIFEKLGVSTRVELALYTLRSQLPHGASNYPAVSENSIRP